MPMNPSISQSYDHVLIHDIVEIDAGDTYAYDTEGLKTQKAREDAAKERISHCYQKIRKKNRLHSLMNSKITRHQNPNLHIPWITCSHCFSITVTAVATGVSIRLLPNRYTEDNRKRSWDLRLYIK